MTDPQCVAFLQWALPRLGLRWAGYRNLRGQVCKRLKRRLAELGLEELAGYRARLEAQPTEWKVLESLCIVTISRFFRDRMVWKLLQDEVLPELARAALEAGERELRCWSIGCASGEEPYTLSMLWTFSLAQRFPALRIRILATDRDETVLARARVARYERGSLRELPAPWLEEAFELRDGHYVLRDRFKTPVELRSQDVRRELPNEGFSLILCRNVVFTYFDEALQRGTLERILTRLTNGGALLIGPHERMLPDTALSPWHPLLGIYRFGAPSERNSAKRR